MACEPGTSHFFATNGKMTTAYRNLLVLALALFIQIKVICWTIASKKNSTKIFVYDPIDCFINSILPRQPREHVRKYTILTSEINDLVL